jgi:hypothetical protein
VWITHERKPVSREWMVGVHRNGIAIVIALHQQHGKPCCVDETQYNSWVQLSSNVAYFFRNWVEEALEIISGVMMIKFLLTLKTAG